MRGLLTLFRYGSTALASAGTDWIVFALFGLLSPAAPGPAGLMTARLAGGLVSFLLNRHWTWRNGRHLAVDRQGRRFLVVYAGSWGLALGLFTAIAGLPAIGPYLAKLITDLICFGVNFLAMHGYVFHRRDGIASLLPGRRVSRPRLSEGNLP